MGYRRNIKAGNFYKQFRLRTKLEGDQKYSNSSINRLLRTSKTALNQIKEERQYYSASTDWPLPNGSTRNYKTWMEVLRQYLDKKCYFTRATNVEILEKYLLLKNVYEVLSLFGLEADLYKATPTLRDCGLFVSLADPNLENVVDEKFHDLFERKFRLNGGLKIEFFSAKYDHRKTFEPGRRLAHAIADSQSTEIDEVEIENWDHQGFGSQKTWYKIFAELPIVNPNRFERLEQKERARQKEVLRDLLFDFDVIITCEPSNRYKKLSDEKKATIEINPITFNFIKLKNGSRTKLPTVEDFGMSVPPIDAFYDDDAGEYIKVDDATDCERAMLQRFLEEHKRIDEIKSKRIQEAAGKILYNNTD